MSLCCLNQGWQRVFLICSQLDWCSWQYGSCAERFLQINSMKRRKRREWGGKRSDWHQSVCSLSYKMLLRVCVSSPSKQSTLAEEDRCWIKQLQTAVYIHALYLHQSSALWCCLSLSLLQIPDAAHIRHMSWFTVCNVITQNCSHLGEGKGGGCMRYFLHNSEALLSLCNAKK